MANLKDGRSTWSLETKHKFVKGLQGRHGLYQDPTYLGFVLLFDFYDSINSPLLCLDEKQGTALYYLKNYDEQKYQYLKQFQKLLQNINVYLPWYWQSIDGLENIWNVKDFKDPYMGGDDAVVSIGTLESIDLPITSLMSLYRNAIYDFKYKRVVLPENLRRFNLMVYIQEMRKIKVPTKQNTMQNNDTVASNVKPFDDNTTKDISAENSPYFLFNLLFCEFDADSGNKFLTDLNMSTREPLDQQLSFRYEKVEFPESRLFLQDKIIVSDREKSLTSKGNIAQAHEKTVNDNLYEESIEDENSIKSRFRAKLALNAIGDFSKNRLKSSFEKLQTNLKERITGFAAAKVNRLLLGNVYNVGASTIQNALQQGSLQSIGNLLRG